MVIVSKGRRLVVQFSPILLLFALCWTYVILFHDRPHKLPLLLGSVLSSVLFLAVALSFQRAVRRIGDDLEVWTVLGRRRLAVKRVFLGVTTGFRSVEIALFLGKSMEPTEPRVSVASYSALGLGRPLRTAKRIAEALELPAPRLAPWLEALS